MEKRELDYVGGHKPVAGAVVCVNLPLLLCDDFIGRLCPAGATSDADIDVVLCRVGDKPFTRVSALVWWDSP